MVRIITDSTSDLGLERARELERLREKYAGMIRR